MEYLMLLRISSISISRTRMTKVLISSDINQIKKYIDKQLKTYKGELYDLYVIKKEMYAWTTYSKMSLTKHIIGKYKDTKFIYYIIDVSNKHNELIEKTNNGQIKFKLYCDNFFDHHFEFCRKYKNNKIQILLPKLNDQHSHFITVGQETIIY